MAKEKSNPAVLMVGDSSIDKVVRSLKGRDYLTYSYKLPLTDSMSDDDSNTLDELIQRNHPDIVVLAGKKIKQDKLEQVYRYIKDSTKTENRPNGIRVVVPETLTDVMQKVDPNDSYLPDPTNLNNLIKDLGVVWCRLNEISVIPKRKTKPKIYVITGVTCAGKTTAAKGVAKLFPYGRLMVKHRSGDLRPHDRAEVDYIVRSEAAIQKDVDNSILIGYTHYGREYGIPVNNIKQTINRGEDAIVVVAETDAVEKIIKRFGREYVRPIYLYTTAEALETRLTKELGTRSPEEIRQRLKEIRDIELASFYANPGLLTWFVPNFNPPYPEDSKDFAAAKEKYWDDREIARSVNWITRILEWECAHESRGVSQGEFEKSFTEDLVQKLFGYDTEQLIGKVKSGDKVTLIENGQLSDYVNWLREHHGQQIDIDFIKKVVGKKVLHVSSDATLGLFFEPYMDKAQDLGRWSDKELLLGYVEKLAGSAVHRNNALTQLPFSAFAGCTLTQKDAPLTVDDGLFYALSLPPSSVQQEGEHRRLSLSFLKDITSSENITSRIYGPDEREKLRRQQAAATRDLGIHLY